MMNEALKALFPAIVLAEGESYAGIMIGDNGESYHLINTSHQLEAATWKEAMGWAKELGLALPNRKEARLQWVNTQSDFEEDWYWTAEEYASGSGCAWTQEFDYGGQSFSLKTYEFRARAVRRLPI
ncbi:DUF1566 domain-containing protein [Chitinibacter bivalviorum]|uniref:DUF1566 domain-containing protein n=1 Tax=Chitinibacter bivalviorum TaxID=2739434 RepID=A0A7H9BGK6_9NEIS|nr:DUF1566 domain-containing protein [Chitinibacter bivalviorum]QLG87669.1 DUF1566 domain-containing protein [Chitinibacter bivalviorum]